MINNQFEVSNYGSSFIHVQKGFELGACDVLMKDTGELERYTAVCGEQSSAYPLLPLNGWRGRDLADYLTGERDDSIFKLGMTFVVPFYVIYTLPAWDGKHTRLLDMYLRKFGEETIHPMSKLVMVTVRLVNDTYGASISIEDTHMVNIPATAIIKA